MTEVPALVTLHLWRVRPRAVLPAAAHSALDRKALRHSPHLTFAKLLGTGHGTTFGVRDADLSRWAMLACWSDTAGADAFDTSDLGHAWRARATETARIDLQPISSRGQWSGREPFGRPAASDPDGPVAVLTRARLRAGRTTAFYRAVPPVAAALHASAGVRLAIGVGEAPVGLQGTFSVWDSASAVRAFAYASPAHAAVVRRTPSERWYREELFARFAVLRARGTVDGQDLRT